ncbi:MAG: hypothetical protein HLX50_02590 [Alteromonadaceae bacterium]|nr:hypothetical protein [Alteromonadaceae bacterium]
MNKSVFRVHSTPTGYTGNGSGSGSVEQPLGLPEGLISNAENKRKSADQSQPETHGSKVSTNRSDDAPLVPRGIQ